MRVVSSRFRYSSSESTVRDDEVYFEYEMIYCILRSMYEKMILVYSLRIM